MKAMTAALLCALLLLTACETTGPTRSRTTPTHIDPPNLNLHHGPYAIAPRGKQEDWNSFQARLDAQEKTRILIPPRGKNEDWNSFQARLKAQETCQVMIIPRGEEEDWNAFNARLKAQEKSRILILPQGEHEDWNSFNARLKASKEWQPR